MRKLVPLKWVLWLILLFASQMMAREIIIQEDETGFCSVDGAVLTSVAGYTGSGYADTDRGVGKSVSWYVGVGTAGSYSLVWRYGNGGGSGARPAKLQINGVTAIDTVDFPHTGTWDNWQETDSVQVSLSPGNHTIRLSAYSEDGLGNIDYIKVLGDGVVPLECIPSYTLTVDQNDPAGGMVSYEPIQDFYEEGTLVTLTAQANPGYFFQSWSGDATSAEAVFTFPIRKNTLATAIFLPDGTTMDPQLTGYATVQDDAGTPYLVTGGALGDTVHATSVEELQTYLSSPAPYVVTFSEHFTGTQTLSVSSHKTLLGIGENPHLQGIEVSINQARNVIVQNVKISHVTPQDAIEINGRSQNIWIDHCELFSDRDHGQDFYDGLLDIKNESSFITISWCRFHDHFKTSLISSGDQQVADSTIRVTYHHNYFYNCGSRLPSIRFGKAHIFNNYYQNDGTAINSRMGACVRVERNYFNQVGTAVMMAFSPEPGSVELIDNYFGSSGYSTSPTCVLEVPYDYTEFLDETADIPFIVGGDAVGISAEEPLVPGNSVLNYPNPFNPGTTIRFTLNRTAHVTLKIFNALGQQVQVLADERYRPGTHFLLWDAKGFASGIYFYRLKADDYVETKKMVLQH